MTFATSQLLAEKKFGRGADVSLVGTGTGSGASPISVTVPAGTTTGDIAVFAAMSSNSILSAPTGGATWNQLHLADTASNEYHGVWWKVCGGSEPGSWSMTHSAGTDVGAAVAVFRAADVDSVLSFTAQDNTLQPIAVTAHPLGFQVLVYLSQAATTLGNPTGDSVSTAVNFQSGTSNNAQVLIAYRDTSWTGDGIPIRCNGANTIYTGAFNIAFYPS